jgi:hypothetical protein
VIERRCGRRPDIDQFMPMRDRSTAGTTYDVVAHCNEEVEEQLATRHHLSLHRATAFECVAAADDEGEVVGSKPGICVGSVAIGPASGGQDYRDLDPRLKSLLAKSETLQLVETVAVSCTANSVSVVIELYERWKVRTHYITVSFSKVWPIASW